MVAFYNLEIFDNPWIQRLCSLSKLLFYQNSNVCNGFFSVNQWPDKTALTVQMDLGKPWLVKYGSPGL